MIPQLYRAPYEDADEDEIRLEFQSQAIQLLPARPSTGNAKWDWYFLMQHHRVPTRLLDWTENPLVALFFAVNEPTANADAAVWVLDPWWLNKKLRAGITGPILPDYEESGKYLRELEEAFSGKRIHVKLPAAIEPPHVDRRVSAQASRFLVFGTTHDLTRSWIVRRDRNARLSKIRIPLSARVGIRAELDDCGINYCSLFPDLEGLAEHIRWRWQRFAAPPSRRNQIK